MVKDINQTPDDYDLYPQEITVVGSTAYFSGNLPGGGYGLYKTDGTPSGTTLIKPFMGRPPVNLMAVGNTLFFTGSSTDSGQELWKSDGTLAGTVQVVDLYPGPTSAGIIDVVEMGGSLYFTYGGLWKSDGTAAGTQLIKDGTFFATTDLRDLTVFNGSLYFGAEELWKSDGTTAGTVMLKDINAGGFHSSPDDLTIVGSSLYFTAEVSATGRELYKTDGTSSGTVLVRDIYTGTGSSNPTNLTNVNGTLYFAATTSSNGTELWKSDPVGGTLGVRDLNAAGSSNPASLTNLNGKLVFTADDGTNGLEPWVSDGTVAGTFLLKDIWSSSGGSDPHDLTLLNGRVYFFAQSINEGTEVFVTDGTTAGTTLVDDFVPGPGTSTYSDLAAFNGSLLFGEGDVHWLLTHGGGTGHGHTQLWKSSGIPGTEPERLSPFIPGNNDSLPDNPVRPNTRSHFTLFHGTIFFTAVDGIHGSELWTTDGTESGTKLFLDIAPDGATIGPWELTVIGDTMYFVEQNGIAPLQYGLYKTDGTVAGTQLVKSWNQQPHDLRNVNGTLFFVANDSNGSELWKSNGTSAGTVLVKNIRPAFYSSYPHNLTNYNGTLLFVASDGVNGDELWKSDGTAAGTVLVKDLLSGIDGSSPQRLEVHDGILYFTADRASGGSPGLFRTDGTAAGTSLIAALTVWSNRSGPTFVPFNGALYFRAGSPFGDQLWKTDGTPAGTSYISGSVSSASGDMAVFNGQLFFSGTDITHGMELWVSDGTSAGTHFFKEIWPGLNAPSNPGDFMVFRDTLYFAADDGDHGHEMWKTDGTAAGTVLFADLDPEGVGAPNLDYGLQVGSRLFFAASSGAAGIEPWVLDFDSVPTAIQLNQNVIAENLPAGSIVGTLTATDGDVGDVLSFQLVSGVGDSGNIRFNIVGNQLVTTAALDFELEPSLSVRVRVTDQSLAWYEAVFTIATSDVNEAPMAVTLGTNNSPMAENSSVTPIATFSVTDDALGTNVLGLSGTDAALFEMVGNALQRKPGTVFDFETKSSYSLIITVSDPTLGGGVAASLGYTVTLSDVDEFDVSTPVDNNSAPNAIPENASPGTSVGLTAFASDSDATNNTITYALTDNAGGRFTINATTGVVTVANAALLDRESAASHSITVQAASTDGSTSTQSFTINVLDVDEFDVGAISDSSALANTLPENSPSGTPFGITAFAADADATNSSITYSLTDDAGGRFQIDSASGVVTVANAALLNYESVTSHSITVQATSTDGSISAQSFTITLTDANEFNVGPVSDTDPAANVVLEGAVDSTVVTGLLAFASDADGTTNGITYSLVDNAGGRFAIDPALGFVTVLDGSLLDYETATSHTITVRATSEDGSFSDQAFTIQMADADEFDVGPLSDFDPAPDSVPENSPTGTPVGVTAFASDADGTNNGITYSLWNTHSGRFAIDPTTGVVTVSNGALLNREAEASWAVTVLATSQDGSVSVKQFVVQITDVNEFKVGTIADTNPAANSIVENCPTGTLVGITGLAVDPDATTNAVTYSLFNTRGGRFAIDASTGVITVANGALIDREAGASWTLTIVATSQDGSVSVKDFVVAVQDVDEYDVGQVFDQDPSTNSVLETAPGGTSVGITGFGVDLDSTNSTITYALTDNAGGRFAINPTTGVVTVAQGAVLDRETAASWPITIQARSADGSVSTKVFTIAISDADEFAVGPISDINAAANAVSETAPAGTDVGITARAVDPDATKSAVTYSLMNNAGGRFAINGTTGVITVANSALLDREASGALPSYDVTVQAKSQDGSSSTKIFTIQITDSDEFDVGLVSDINAAANTVAENSPAGTLVGLTARATDGDVSNNTVTYSLTNNAGNRFQIDPATGVVSVMAGAVLDFEAQTSWDITARAASSDGSFSTQTFTIAVTNVFDAPRVTLSKSSVAENLPTGTVVGTLGLADSNATSPVYTLVTGTGSTDNSKFSITGTQLKTKASFDFETKSSYSIRVQMKGAGGVTVTQVFTILVTNVNEGPTGLTLSPASIAENNAVGATVGTLAGVDPDTGETLNYTLVSGTGSTDNAKFTISGNQLKAAAVFDYETKRSYSIRVRVTDAAGLTYEKTLTISVTNGPG